MAKLIVVNRQDKILGLKDKDACHSLKGILHRGFSVFVFNKKGEVLLQKRSKNKKLWPGFWSNTCCSHPQPGETCIQAGERRLKEYDGEISLNPKEAAEYRFVSLKNLRKEIEEKPETFTPWLEKEVSLFLRQEK